jgi:hypothetical protein
MEISYAANELRQQGRMIRKGSAEYERLKKAIVPPYDAGKFPKWHIFLQALYLRIQNEVAVEECLDNAHHRTKLLRLRLPATMRCGTASIRKNGERAPLALTNLAELNQVLQLFSEFLAGSTFSNSGESPFGHWKVA